MAGLVQLLGLLLACVPQASFQPPVLVMSEVCYYPLDVELVREGLKAANISVSIASEQDTCDDERILNFISSTPRMVMGSFKPDLCSHAHFISSFRNNTLLSWNCPLIHQNIDHHRGIRLSPSISTISGGFLRIITEMKWRSVAIISSNDGWWPSLAQTIDVNLRELGIVSRHFFQIGNHFSKEIIRTKLEVLKRFPCNALFVCASANASGKTILKVLDDLQLYHHDIITVYMDVSNLPPWLNLFRDTSNNTETISILTRKNALIFTDNATAQLSAEQTMVRRAQMSFSAQIDGDSSYVLGDFRDDVTLRPLLTVTVINASDFCVEKDSVNLGDWTMRHKQANACEECASNVERVLTVVIILGCSCLLVSAVLGAVALARKRLVTKKVSKGPYKVLLTASDFDFPQIADSRRVDESMEAMLCCWLQQLQEFGGPEVEKPDLLLGSGGASMRTPARTGSSPNLAKQLIVDLRVRYKGDLVQMKPVFLSTGGGGGCDLKSKSVELLMLIHGLRHENLNPLVGCLAEPPRAALVSEYCARGSLQDVLQQDDIKLDWSFRLSLLTDLVRGMKYLHSSPIRVHGHLSSRNCVIDARWVLKLTDYGLPALYEAQGVQPSEKSARGASNHATRNTEPSMKYVVPKPPSAYELVHP